MGYYAMDRIDLLKVKESKKIEKISNLDEIDKLIEERDLKILNALVKNKNLTLKQIKKLLKFYNDRNDKITLSYAKDQLAKHPLAYKIVRELAQDGMFQEFVYSDKIADEDFIWYFDNFMVGKKRCNYGGLIFIARRNTHLSKKIINHLWNKAKDCINWNNVTQSDISQSLVASFSQFDYWHPEFKELVFANVGSFNENLTNWLIRRKAGFSDEELEFLYTKTLNTNFLPDLTNDFFLG